MSWPYIGKRVENVGTSESPVYSEMPVLYWIPGKGKGPYQSCRTCRETRDAIRAKVDDTHRFEIKERFVGEGESVTMTTEMFESAPPKYPPVKVEWAIPGAANCAKHIIRFHKKNGTWTEELEEDVLRREAINEKARKGAYYTN